MKRCISLVLGAAVAAGFTVHGQQAREGWPPGLRPASTTSPVLSPEEALKSFVLPPGYRLELVASEPLIQDPVVIDWDPDGRMWAVEMPGYMLDITATRELEPLGRIVVFEDTNGDGRMDKRTVFADGLVLARSLKVLDRGVLVGEPPNLWLMRDTNGDLKMDTRELVTDTYGRREANVEHNANGLFWAMDNRMYTSETDMYVRLRNGKFEVNRTLSRGQWGLSQDDAGRIYRNTNSSALYVDLVPTPYFTRNPTMLRTRGSYEFLGQDGDGINITWPIHPTRGVNRGYQNGVLREDGTLASFTAVAAPTIYRGDRLPAELSGNAFVAEPSGNLVSRIIVDDDGKGLRGRKAYAQGEFIVSTDERFRPVYLSSAPDGTLYVVDLYRGIIQHKGYITEYLRDQILSRKLEQPTALGRVYRVVHETTKRDSAPALSKAPAAKLVDTLSHPNGWWRDTAQRLLVERGDTSAVPALKKLAAGARDYRARLHALWTLDGMDSADADTVARALTDSHRDVRAAAVRVSEKYLKEPGHALHAAVIRLASDPDWAVRAQVAASLGELPAGERELALVSVLDLHGTDPIAADAALSGMSGIADKVLDGLLSRATETPARSAAITLVAGTIVTAAQDAPVQAVFDKIADPQRAAWQRSALLRGAEVSLLGAAAPGSPAGRGRGRGAAAAEEPCPTCPGGRAGPGGAPAFPRGGTAAAAAGAGAGAAAGAVAGRGGRGGGRGRGGAGGPALKVSREPALSQLASRDTSELGKRSAAVLARVEWPGKAGVVAATPLTPAEQARFEAGREVYKNLCVACHQADGRGAEKLGKPLVASEFTLDVPGIPVRVLINGKEGPVGLMPPLGGALSDDQIAAVLTYVRREWGNAGTAVDAAAVADVRKATAGRSRPWTDQELAGIRGGR
jgi:mono/diheme cytochrome c family protein/glucose/arabinose dehydrogenase